MISVTLLSATIFRHHTAPNVGQTLQVGMFYANHWRNAITQADAAEQGVVIKPAQNSTVAVVSHPILCILKSSSGEQSANKMLPNKQANRHHGHSACNVPTASTTQPTVSRHIKLVRLSPPWRWPTEGKVIPNLCASEGQQRD
ncbi:hypothetical protein ACNKHU_16615 [Shigella flexneri]